MQAIYSCSNLSNHLSQFQVGSQHLSLWNIKRCVSKQVVQISAHNVHIILYSLTNETCGRGRSMKERLKSEVTDEMTLLLYISHARILNENLIVELERCNILSADGSPSSLGQLQLSLWNQAQTMPRWTPCLLCCWPQS